MTFVYDDGGRAAAGFKGTAGDCVVRAIAIAAERPYAEVYDALHDAMRDRRSLAALELRYGRNARRHATPRSGVQKKTTARYLASLGWRWVPTMAIGKGCTVHLTPTELPTGRLIVSVSKHLVAVVDGVIHDTHDPSRGGTRCVYGYWQSGVQSA